MYAYVGIQIDKDICVYYNHIHYTHIYEKYIYICDQEMLAWLEAKAREDELGVIFHSI